MQKFLLDMAHAGPASRTPLKKEQKKQKKAA
jgi:hypothetical protein